MRQRLSSLGATFPHAFADGTPNRMTWDEALRLGGKRTPAGEKRVGEIRADGDLEGVPREVVLKAIYIPDGDGVIRWGHPRHMNDVLGCMGYHDGFRCVGDALPAGTREGYIVVKASGEIRVCTPSRGGGMPGGGM